MTKLPSLNEKSRFEYENNFYLSCGPERLAKVLSHYELFKKSLSVPGDLIECGVFKGVSLSRWIKFREILSSKNEKKIIGFDTYSEFPETFFQGDIKSREQFIKSAGLESIGKDQLKSLLGKQGLDDNVSLVEGDIRKTIPEYLKLNPNCKISLLNIDVDIYESTKFALETLFPYVSTNGVIIFDDYGAFAGANKAIDEYLMKIDFKKGLQKFPFANNPSYIIK